MAEVLLIRCKTQNIVCLSNGTLIGALRRGKQPICKLQFVSLVCLKEKDALSSTRKTAVIDCFVFYAVSAIFQPCINGESLKYFKMATF